MTPFRASSRLLALSSLLLAGLTISQPAAAIVPVGGWGYSLGYAFDRLIGVITANDDLWYWEIDPAAETLYSGRVSLRFDPEEFRVVSYGWQGDFGLDPSLPAPPVSAAPFNPLDPNGEPWALQAPNAALAHANVQVDNQAGTLVIEFDWGAGGYTPATDGHFNFFGIQFAVPKNTTGFRPVPRGTGSIGLIGGPEDMATLGTNAPTYLACSGGYCGEAPTDFVREVPEPAAWSMAGVGAMLAAGLAVHRRRQAK